MCLCVCCVCGIAHCKYFLCFLHRFKTEDCNLNEYICGAAASGNHFEIVRWIYDQMNGDISYCFEPDASGVCAGAAKAGNIQMLQWALDKDFRWNSKATTNAAAGGHLALLQYAMKTGCTLHSCDVASGAASHGHIRILDWILSIDAQLSLYSALEEAAFSGQLAVCQWARANGKVIDLTGVCASATRGGHLEVSKQSYTFLPALIYYISMLFCRC